MVAVAVFLALGFAFYVFFVPFVGSRVIQYVVMGIYTPLVRFLLFFSTYSLFLLLLLWFYELTSHLSAFAVTFWVSHSHLCPLLC